MKNSTLDTTFEEYALTFDRGLMPVHHVVRLLEQASARTGFSPADIVALVDCELETEYLLGYISAVLTNGMN